MQVNRGSSKYDHIGIAVESIEESAKFYQTLGLTIDHIEEVPQEGVRVAMIEVGETRIELLEPTTEDSPVRRFLDKRGPGVHHICFATDDIHADQLKLEESGADVLRPQPTLGAGGCWVQFIHPRSAGGVLVELSQAPDEVEAAD